MKIGDRVFVRGYIDEIRKDTVIIRNAGGYFGTIPSEVITGALPPAQPDPNCSEIPNNSDTISRQAAIDAIDEISNEVADGYGFDYAKWREYFCELPSAQPKNENLKFLEFLWNTINPNEMEQYLEMYSSKEVKSNG